MKKILFYIDPIVNNGDFLFRYPTLKWHVNDLMNLLTRPIQEGDVDLRIVLSDELLSHARSEGVGDDWPLIPINANDLPSIFDDINSVQKSCVQGNYCDKHIEHFRKVIIKALNGYNPDVVIVYESCAPYMQKIFPDAQVLNETWGVFSRPPMPAFATFDPMGTYQNSYLYKNMESLRKISVTDETKATMNRLRELVAKPLIIIDPCFERVNSAKMDYRKILLLPLQIDNYFSFTECTEFKSHLDLIDAVFKGLPSDVGVIVTQHQDHNPVLNDAKINLLRKKYQNFIYFDDLAHVPMLSNFIVNYVDGIITVSSAVGFHAALMKIPVFVIGSSHVSVVSSGLIEDILFVLDSTPEVDFDGVLHWIFTRYQIFVDVEKRAPEKFLSFLNEIARLKNMGVEQMPARYTNNQLIELFEVNVRLQPLIEIFKQKGVRYCENELYKKIVEAKIVSFDLFDTLVQRPFVEPHYLFQLIEPRVRRELGLSSFAFMRFRRMAEESARKERGWKEVNINLIYKHFMKLTGLSHEECIRVSEIEMQAERQVLVRRESICHTLDFAKKLGKVVSIITDIYLEEFQVIEILNTVGIKNYDHLFVSAAEDLRKHDGAIYPFYLGKIYDMYRVKANGVSILHIGDNGHADCDMAIPFNIRAHVIPKAIDNLKSSEWRRVFGKNLDKRFVVSDILIGIIANRFDGALAGCNKDTLFGDSLFRVGFAAAGPMLFSFVQWLIRKVREEKHEVVYFLARDGYLLKLIYDRIRGSGYFDDLPPSRYLHVSRRAAAVPALIKWIDIVDLYHLSFGNRRIGDFIEARFGLPQCLIDVSILNKYGYSINDNIHQGVDVERHLDLLRDLSGAILDNASREREALLRHFADNGLVTGGENVCFVDIGYSGSIQKYINRLFGNASIAGYYLLTHEAARRNFEGVICEGFYCTFDEQRMADCHPLNDHVFLFESVLSSSEGSVVRHSFEDGNLVMVTKESNRELERLNFISKVHAGVDAFASDVVGYLGEYLEDVQFGPYLGSKPFFHLAMYPTPRDAKLFSGLKVENGFGGGDAWLLFDAKSFLNSDGALVGKPLEIAMGSSQWKQAAASIYIKSTGTTVQNACTGSDVVPLTLVQNLPFQSLTDLRKKDFDFPILVRKYLKFKKDPYRFFAESRNPFVRIFSIFYRRYKLI